MNRIPTTYFGSIATYVLMLKGGPFLIEKWEYFQKQTLRNRCEIYGPNGRLKLIIPLVKWGKQSYSHQVQISHDENWISNHWKSIETAYRASAFFEFYELDFKRFFDSTEAKNLMDFNTSAMKLIFELLEKEIPLQFSSAYEEQNPDWRVILNPKSKQSTRYFNFQSYFQVFGDRFGFIPNLSILDLLFNLGPASIDYIRSVEFNLRDGKKNKPGGE